jgi:flagellar hook assembly protein FlgD
MGRKVRTLVSDIETAGYKQINWDGVNEYGEIVSSGIYICTFYAKNIENNEIFTKNVKLTVLK